MLGFEYWGENKWDIIYTKIAVGQYIKVVNTDN